MYKQQGANIASWSNHTVKNYEIHVFQSYLPFILLIMAWAWVNGVALVE